MMNATDLIHNAARELSYVPSSQRTINDAKSELAEVIDTYSNNPATKYLHEHFDKFAQRVLILSDNYEK